MVGVGGLALSNVALDDDDDDDVDVDEVDDGMLAAAAIASSDSGAMIVC